MAIMHPLLRFRPTDEQLFAHYLVGKSTGAPLPPGLIGEYDIYSQEPWKIFNTTSDRMFYVFTTLRKNKSRVLRTAGSGTWKEQHKFEIRDVRGDLVGYKKSFKFKEGSGSSATSGRWIMYEYSMCDEMKCKYVLCRIKYYKDEKKSGEKAIVISDDTLLRFEDENQRAKRVRLLDDDDGHRTNVVHDSAAALPLTTDQAQPAAPQAFSSSAYAEPLLITTGAEAASQMYTGDAAFPGFSSGANHNSLPLMATATATMQQDNDEWMKGWMIAELDSLVYSDFDFMSGPLALMKGSYTNELVRASSPPAMITPTTTTPPQDMCNPMSPAFGSNTTFNSLFTTVAAEAATMPSDLCYATDAPAFGCNQNANALPTIATPAHVDIGNTSCPDFDGGAYVDLLPMMAEQVNNGGWMDGLMFMETDPVIPFSHSNPFGDPSEGDTDAMLASALGRPFDQTWDPTSLHQQRSFAESQDQDVPVPLSWADEFLQVLQF